MNIKDLNEDARIVKGVNTTVDVDVDQIPVEAKNLGNKVTIDGVPPFLRVDGKVKEQRYTAYEWSLMEGGHSLEEPEAKPKLFDFDKY